MSLNRLKRQKTARQNLAKAFEHPATTLVIHYSCESFYDRPDGSSPRITSIAVRNLETAQTHSFSIHMVAERRAIPMEEIEGHYDDLERVMLDEFFEFVRQNSSQTWMHWNMRDANYGFPAIEHRHQVLGGEPVTIHDGSKLDLASTLIDIYGPGYAPHGDHGRLMSIMEINQITARDALNGAQEAAAFDEQNYVGLHQSTLRKVDVFANIATRAFDGTIKTKASWRQVHGGTPRAMVECLKDHPWLTVTVALATIASLFVGILQFGQGGS